MTLHLVQLERKAAHKSFRLTRPGATTLSEVRPDVVVPVESTRAVLAAATRNDVASGGVFSGGPAGVQLWSGPWNSPHGGPGTAEHLGSVDWSYDTPVKHSVTIYRVMLTAEGAETGLTTDSLLGTVLGLAGVAVPGLPAVAVPLPREPHATSPWRAPNLMRAR
jgi:hypothetical protein